LPRRAAIDLLSTAASTRLGKIDLIAIVVKPGHQTHC
jgi:hypothetical protein